MGGCLPSRDPARLVGLNVESLQHPPPAADFSRLCSLLTECVRAGASVGFVEPIDRGEVEAYWQRVCSEASAGSRLILVVREAEGGPVAGSAQLALESRPNGRHRAEVQKVMVFPELRRRGIAAALMSAVEAAARERGVSLLFLDTSEGRGGATDFYSALATAMPGEYPAMPSTRTGRLPRMPSTTGH